MARIIKYEFKRTKDGRELILWQALARGQKAVLGSIKFKSDEPPSVALANKLIADLLPTADTP